MRVGILRHGLDGAETALDVVASLSSDTTGNPADVEQTVAATTSLESREMHSVSSRLGS